MISSVSLLTPLCLQVSFRILGRFSWEVFVFEVMCTDLVLYACICIPPTSLLLSNQPKTLVDVEGHHDQYSYEQNATRLCGSIPSFSDEDFLCRGV
jgi:hypothetical protein